MMPSHHPDPEELLAYATGAAEPWLSTLMACHLTLCPTCRQELELLETVGGALFSDLDADCDVDTSAEGLISLARSRPPSGPAPAPARVLPDEIRCHVPRPLHGFMRDSQPRFRFLAPGVAHVPLGLAVGGRPLRLVRFKRGFVIPEHAHEGLEWLLILSGELTDEATGERYARGDVSRRDTDDVHCQRIGKAEPCVGVFAHLGAPVPTTMMGRILNRIVGL